MYKEINMSREDALHWSPANQSLSDTAEIIHKLFVTPAGEEQKLQIASFIQDFCFAFNYKNRYIEEASIINLKTLVQNHFGGMTINDALTEAKTATGQRADDNISYDDTWYLDRDREKDRDRDRGRRAVHDMTKHDTQGESETKTKTRHEDSTKRDIETEL